MGATATALICFAGWFALLSVMMGVYRGRFILSGTEGVQLVRQRRLRPGRASGSRLTRARDNCFESLPLFAAIALGASIAGRLDVTDGLAMWVFYFRVGQSVTHLISTSVPAVNVRAVFFFLQMLIYLYWVLRLI